MKKVSQVGHEDCDIHRWSCPEDSGVLLCHFALPSQTGRHAKCSALRRESQTTKFHHWCQRAIVVEKHHTKTLTLTLTARVEDQNIVYRNPKALNRDKKLGEKETLNLHSKKNPPKQEEEEEEEEDQALEKGKKEKKTLDLSGIPS